MSQSELSIKKSISIKSISRHSHHGSIYSESVDSSRFTARSRLNEMVDNYSLLVAKQEKKLDWTQQSLVQLFDENSKFKAYKSLATSNEHCKV